MTPRDALKIATTGGAQVLGRNDIGRIEAGYCADIAMFRTDTLSMAGAAVHDPIGALLLCSSSPADYTVVNGKVLVREGRFVPYDIEPLIEKHNFLAGLLAQAAH